MAMDFPFRLSRLTVVLGIKSPKFTPKPFTTTLKARLKYLILFGATKKLVLDEFLLEGRLHVFEGYSMAFAVHSHFSDVHAIALLRFIPEFTRIAGLMAKNLNL